MKTVIFCATYIFLFTLAVALVVVPNLLEMGYQTDKALHVFLFMLVSLPATLTGRPFQHIAIYTALLILMGICAEVLQMFIPARSAQIEDLLSNLLGIGLGLLIGYLLRSGYHAKA